MNFVPKDKYDLDAIAELHKTEDTIVYEHIDELLVWIQDINWPVAQGVVNRISKFEELLYLPIQKVFDTNDYQWQYFIITHLLPEAGDKLINLLKPLLTRIIDNPTKRETEEEIDNVARELLDD